MFYLIITAYYFGVLIPDKYPNEDACHKAARDSRHYCIPAPDIPTSHATILYPPSYYKGDKINPLDGSVSTKP